MPHSAEEQKHIDNIKTRIGYTEFIIMIATLMATNAFAIDIMLPAMSNITQSLNVSNENDQHYIIFVYLLGFGFSQLLFGPISDRFGRRKPIVAGLAFYSITSCACAFAPSFAALLVLRAIQGAASAATRVLTISIVRDLYGGRKMAEVMSIVMMVFMICPIIAPAAGQGLLFLGPWQGIFVFMALTGLLIAIWVYMRLPETLYEKRALSFFSVARAFKTVLTNRISICYTLAFSVILGSLFGSLSTAEQVYGGVYKLGPLFPLAFAVAATFQALSSFLNSRFVGKWGMRVISHSMLLVYCVAAFILLLWAYIDNGVVPLPIYMVLFTIIMFSFGAVGANFNSMAMEPLGKIAGTASSIFGFLQTTIGASLGFFIGQQFDGSITPLAVGFSLFSLLAVVLVFIAEKGQLFQGRHRPDSKKQN